MAVAEECPYDFNKLASVIRDNTNKNLDRSAPGCDISAIVCIECVQVGDLMLAEHKMSTKVGRRAANAYRTMKQDMYWESLRG